MLGLDPLPVPPHVFGLGGRELAYGRFARAAGGLEVEAYQALPLPEGLVTPGPLGGLLHDPAALKEPVAQLVREAERKVEDASLVLPDAWLRVAFAEVTELPRLGPKRDELLRFKLKRLVPFRVEDLRLTAVEVPPLAGQEEPRRLLLCFGVEVLLAQLEAVFASQGVRIGQIVPRSLATAAAAHEVMGGEELAGLLVAGEEGYALTFLRRGEPVLHRYRALVATVERDALVIRDLKLTQSFLEERVPGVALTRLLFVAAENRQAGWAQRLAAGFDAPAVLLGREQLPLRGALPPAPLERLASLVGAAVQEAA